MVVTRLIEVSKNSLYEDKATVKSYRSNRGSKQYYISYFRLWRLSRYINNKITDNRSHITVRPLYYSFGWMCREWMYDS